jgi:nucleoid DNA-binding protein
LQQEVVTRDFLHRFVVSFWGLGIVKKVQFVAAVAKASSLTAAQVSKVLRALEDVSATELKEAGEVRIPGLVVIKRLPRSERIVRNPRTREEFVMGASVVVKAKPATTFADRVKAENPVPASD